MGATLMSIYFDISRVYEIVMEISEEFNIFTDDEYSISEEVDHGTEELLKDFKSFGDLVSRCRLEDLSLEEKKILLSKFKVLSMGLSTIFDNLNDEVTKVMKGLAELPVSKNRADE
jgi:hypothetical protein